MQPSQNTKKSDTAEKRPSWFQKIDWKTYGIKIMILSIFYLIWNLGNALLQLPIGTWQSWMTLPAITMAIGFILAT